MYMHMQDQNICIDAGKYLQTPKFVISKIKKIFTPGLPDPDTLMVQGRLSNLSHATSAPAAPWLVAVTVTWATGYQLTVPLSESHGAWGGMRRELNLIAIIFTSSITQKERVRCAVAHADYFSNCYLHYRDKVG